MSSKKILVLAYAISPTRGSEYSQSWNYVTEMSKDNDLVVLYGASGDHMGDVDELEQFIINRPIPNVRFIAVKPNRIAQILNILNKKGLFAYSFFFAYNMWHRQVYYKAKELIHQEKFDLIHFLVPIGYREPGYLWKLKLPYIWGPMGGTKNLSRVLIKALSFSGIIKLGGRAIINYIQLRFHPRLKKALTRVDVLLTSTTHDQNNFVKIYNKESIYIPENGIKFKANRFNDDKYLSENIKLIWIGGIDSRKALIILLEAMKRMKNLQRVRLDIVGDGILKSSLMKFSKKNSLLNNITWHGAVKREKVFDLLSKSHLHIITSVTEANTNVIFEAMSAGVPTISIDHCGMHDTICEKCGIKIPIQSYEQIINEYAKHIDRLVAHPEEIKKLSFGVIECAKKYTWNLRQDFFNNLYELAIDNWNKKQNQK